MAYFEYKSKKIFYREEGKGELLIVIPGNTASSIAHEKELEYYGKGYHAVSLDILGTGQSDRLEKWTINWWEEGAHQVKALIEHLKYKKAILMGTSGGAVIALLGAVLYPDKIKAVIADSFVEKFSKSMLKKNIIDERNNKVYGQIQFWKFAHGKDWERVIKEDTKMMIEFVNQGGEWFNKRLGEIICPVLLTASKKDHMLPDIEEEICNISKRIEKSKVFINDEGFHPLICSQPEDFRIITDYFLKQLQEIGNLDS